MSTIPGPKYRPLLRPIGAYLDTLDARDLVLAETEQGFIWRCFAREDPGQLLYGVIALEDIPQITESIKASRTGRVPDLVIDEEVDQQPRQRFMSRSVQPAPAPQPERRLDAVCPFGYEELLRCLSYKLDREAATSFVLQESAETVLVQFTLTVPVFVQVEPERFNSGNYFHEDLLTSEDIVALVQQVRGFRGTNYYR
jgi:hypothetical protein